MRRTEISKQLQEAVIKAYTQVCDKCWTYQEAFAKIAKMPAPRYFISEKQARLILAPMMRGDFEQVNLFMPLKRKMYYSLFRTVLKMSESPMYRDKTLSYICKYAVLQPAPEFFMEPFVLYRTRHLIKKGLINTDGSHAEGYHRKRLDKKKKR